jgi:hypothetical protein
MPDLLVERRDEHLKKSQAFLHEANNLFRDDLLYRSALADAVSAIKHSLQAYLWMRVGTAAAEQRYRWQEIALDGSMPQLVRACTEAGLHMSDVERTIRELNDARNRRTHDFPRSPIPPEQAAAAVQTAITVRDRVVAAISGAPATVATRAASGAAEPAREDPATSQAVGALARVAPTGDRPTAAARSSAAATTDPANGAGTSGQPGEVVLSGDEDEEEMAAGDDIPALAATIAARLRVRWTLGLVAALVLVLGALLGAAVTYPIAGGDASTLFGGGTSSAVAAKARTATPHPTEPVLAFAGDLIITSTGCGITPTSVTIHNTGAAVLNWTVGSPDASNPGFSPPADPSPRPTLSGQLAPSASTTLIVTGMLGAHVVLISDGGAGEVVVGGC